MSDVHQASRERVRRAYCERDEPVGAEHEREQRVGARARVDCRHAHARHNVRISLGRWLGLGLGNGRARQAGAPRALQREAGPLERLEHQHTPADVQQRQTRSQHTRDLQPNARLPLIVN